MKYLCVILLATSVAGRFTDRFSLRLAKENADKNMVVSPLSAEIAMTMLYMGAKNNTATQISSVLNLSKSKKKVARKYRKFLIDLQESEKNVTLELANHIYVNDQYSLVPEYTRELEESFRAEAESINVADPNKAAAIVNNWVTDETRGKTTKIVTSGDINPDLIAMLLNAIYFKGQWEYKFNESDTKEVNFHVSRKDKIPVQMMFQKRELKASDLDHLDAKVIELPYHNSNLSMLIFLPNSVMGLGELEDRVTGFSKPLDTQQVNLGLPRFKIEFEKDITVPLITLGIWDAFNSNANFQGIVEKPQPFFIKKVIQKASIEVNEEGVEEADSTETLSKMDGIPMDFIADHPFAFIIRDEKTVYFQGHVVRP